jgi:glycosyltransferase involved in cell wall biosynthesis
VTAAVNRRATRRFLSRHRPFDAALIMSLRRLGLAPIREVQNASVPMVITVHDDWPVFYSKPVASGWLRPVREVVDYRLLAHLGWQGLAPQRVVYLSDSVRRAVQRSGVPFPDGVLLPQGVDLEQFTPPVQNRSVPQHPTLLFVGRIHPSKAPDVAIDTLSCLRKWGHDASLVMAGTAADASYLQALRRRARRLRVHNSIHWQGWVPRDRLPELYRSADVLLFASRLEHEGQGLSYLEAMACGLPVVAYPSGGAREFLQRHVAARIAARCDGDALAREVVHLVNHPDDHQSQIRSARRVVEKHASLNHYIHHLTRQLVLAASNTRGSKAPPPSYDTIPGLLEFE